MNQSEYILKETDCLTEQKMRSYLQGRLDREEKHEVEAHVASCYFCAEALDGLSEMKKPEELPFIVQQMQNRFSRHLRKRTVRSSGIKHKGYIRLTVIAIVILTLLLLAYFAIDIKLRKERQLEPSIPAQEQKEPIQP